MYNYHDIEVYRDGFDLAIRLHRQTESFPREERYSMVAQMRRSSKRICATIAEGFGRSEAEFKRYLGIAHGSVQETKVWIEFAQELEYLLKEEARDLWRDYDTLGKRIYRFRETWRDFSEVESDEDDETSPF